MMCSVHQPNFIPYLGFFDKVKKSDVFVVYDTAQYSKNDFHNRNRIKTPQGAQWLTLPVSLHLGDRIKDVATAPIESYRDKHLKTIIGAYKKAPFFADIFPLIENVYQQPVSHMVDITVPLLTVIIERLAPHCRIVLASKLSCDLNLRSTEALVEIIKKVGADTYLSGPGARDYLEEPLFGAIGARVEWQDFHHPVYHQLWGGEFVPNLSVIDALFMMGFEGVKKLLTN